MKGLVYGEEFAYLAKEHQHRQAADRRLLRKNREEEKAKRSVSFAEVDKQDNHVYDEDDDDYGTGYAFDDGDDDDDYGVVDPGDNDSDPRVIETNTGIHTVEDVYRNADDDGTIRFFVCVHGKIYTIPP